MTPFIYIVAARWGLAMIARWKSSSPGPPRIACSQTNLRVTIWKRCRMNRPRKPSKRSSTTSSTTTTQQSFQLHPRKSYAHSHQLSNLTRQTQTHNPATTPPRFTQEQVPLLSSRWYRKPNGSSCRTFYRLRIWEGCIPRESALLLRSSDGTLRLFITSLIQSSKMLVVSRECLPLSYETTRLPLLSIILNTYSFHYQDNYLVWVPNITTGSDYELSFTESGLSRSKTQLS